MINGHSQVALRLSRRGFLTISAGAVAFIASNGRLSSRQVAAQSASDFLDSSVVHDISATFDQTIYDAMIQNFSDTGDKDWIEATVTIDGSTYEKSAMRLKGNSSLGGLGGGFGGNRPQIQVVPEVDGTPVADGGQTRAITGGPGGDISADKPEGLPWLIRLDKYEKDQNHNGVTELVIRSNGSATSLNEAVALDVLAEAGLASQLAASTAFSVNGSAPALRLAIEHPNDAWMMRHFSEDGLLFKSESTGDWSYRGDDPAAYDEVFDLEAGGSGDDSVDYQPLFAFLDFINNSDDTTFETELPTRLDIDGFAVYLTMMELIENFDDIDGPGNNSYLYSDPVTAQKTVVPWDMNLAFGSSMGGGMRTTQIPEGVDPSDLPQFGEDGPTIVIDGTPVSGEDIQVFGGPGRAGGPGGMANPLVQRFSAVPAFATLLEEQAISLRASLYDSGVAAGILARWVAVLEKGALSMVDQATITTESSAIAIFFTQS